MARINENFLKLQAGYLFPEIARRVKDFAAQNPDAKIIKMGIGDVTEPLPEAIRTAMHEAIDEMGAHDTFKGYGPYEGYDFLRDAIVENEYKARGCDVRADEIIVSDGSKCDTGNILDILGPGNTIAITDPVYPVYVDTNVMAGNTGPVQKDGKYEGLVYLPLTAENNFTAAIPDRKLDIIYLCFPNNPTGAVASKSHLEDWVAYARKNKSIILFDGAYEAFIRDSDIPRSIYEIEGARDCAIEFRSFSKSAGFTGTRCAWTVVPKDLKGQTADGKNVSVFDLWYRRQSTKYNSVSYVVQKGAAAAYSKDGQAQVRQLVDFYMENARIIRENLAAQGLKVYGGENAPYVWVKTPDNLSSWDYFDRLLRDYHIVGTPGSGFGAAGEGYFRLSAFNSRKNVEEAVRRLAHKKAA